MVSGIRKFGDEIYKLHADEMTKEEAKGNAEFLRSEGIPARMTKLGGKYAVWIGRRKN